MFSCGVAGDLYLLVVLLKIHVFLWCSWRFVSTGGVAGDLCFLVVLLEICIYWWCCWRFMFSCDVAGDSYLLVALLKIRVFLWCCWRFVSTYLLVGLLEIHVFLWCYWKFGSTGGVSGDSCFLVVLLEIRIYWWGCWRFMFSCGVAGDSCLPTAFLEIHVSWDATPCWLVNSYRLSEWSQCLHLQGQQSGCNIPNNLQRHSLFNRTALLLWKTCNIHHNWFAVTTKYVHVYTQSHYMVSRYLICISYWD